MPVNIEAISEWNPWWRTGKVPGPLLGRPRGHGDLMSSMQVPVVTAIVGVRRSGKSTLMFQMVKHLLDSGVPPGNVLFVNMDDEAFRDTDIPSIESAYRQHFQPKGQVFIFYDEVQAMEGWEASLKKSLDLKKDVKYMVTGSSAVLLGGEFSTLLTGRNLTFTVNPLSFREHLRFNGTAPPGEPAGTDDIDRMLHHIDVYMEHGGFPEVQLTDEPFVKRSLLRQYFNDIVYRDIVYRHNVEASKVAGLAVHLLTNFCNPFTMRALRRATGLSFDTMKQYIAYLEESHLLRVLSHFSYSSKPGLSEQRPRKAYCVDTGLRNAVSYRITGDVGRMAENVVACELFKRHDRVFYWSGRKEVDFVVAGPSGRLEALNVCYDDDVPDREIEGLRELSEEFGSRVGDSTVLTRNASGERDGIRLVPLWKWLLSLDD